MSPGSRSKFYCSTSEAEIFKILMLFIVEATEEKDGLGALKYVAELVVLHGYQECLVCEMQESASWRKVKGGPFYNLPFSR